MSLRTFEGVSSSLSPLVELLLFSVRVDRQTFEHFLANVKRIVENHQGTVTVDSEKGRGSTFTIKLPLIA